MQTPVLEGNGAASLITEQHYRLLFEDDSDRRAGLQLI